MSSPAVSARMAVLLVVSAIALFTLTGCAPSVDQNVACPVAEVQMKEIFGSAVKISVREPAGEGIYAGLPIVECSYDFTAGGEPGVLSNLYLESVEIKASPSLNDKCFACSDGSQGVAHPEWSPNAWLDFESPSVSEQYYYEASFEAGGRYWHLAASGKANASDADIDTGVNPVVQAQTIQIIAMVDFIVHG